MKKYISISFLPGSAGNFFSRCLNILDGAYCFIPANTKQIPQSINDKLNVLSYQSVLNKDFNQRDWINFEKQLIPYDREYNHSELPNNSLLIWYGHPHHLHGCVNLKGLAGEDDQSFDFYIDPGIHIDWCCMNAFYKNSYLDVNWFINGQHLLKTQSVYKIQLTEFLKEWNDFYLEFLKVCKIISHNITVPEKRAVEQLYCQWKKTTLDYSNIKNFKRSIGLI